MNIDHLVLMVKDIETTSQFYSFLGEPVLKSEDQVVYQVGDTKIFFGLPYTSYGSYDKDAIGLNHLAFGVKSKDELVQMKDGLDQNGIKNSGIQIDKYGGKEFIWFDDPDGYRLEFYLR